MEHSYAIILRHVSFIIRQARAMSALSNVSNSIKTYFTKYRSKNFSRWRIAGERRTGEVYDALGILTIVIYDGRIYVQSRRYFKESGIRGAVGAVMKSYDAYSPSQRIFWLSSLFRRVHRALSRFNFPLHISRDRLHRSFYGTSLVTRSRRNV